MDQQHPKWRLIEWAQKLSDEDLRQAIEFLSDECKTRLKRAAQAAAPALKEGDWVEVLEGTPKLPAGTRGHIVKIRRSGRIDVHFPDVEGLWTMTATLVRKVDGPAKK